MAAPAEEAQSFTTYLKSRIPPSAQAPAFPRKKLVPDDDIPIILATKTRTRCTSGHAVAVGCAPRYRGTTWNCRLLWMRLPRVKRSERSPRSSPSACSGDMYCWRRKRQRSVGDHKCTDRSVDTPRTNCCGTRRRLRSPTVIVPQTFERDPAKLECQFERPTLYTTTGTR